MNFLIVNQCSTNKGDRAVLYFILRELEKNKVNKVTVSTGVPAYWDNFKEFANLQLNFIPFGSNIYRNTRKKPNCFDKIILKFKDIIFRKIFFPYIRNAFVNNKKASMLPLIVNNSFLKSVNDADVIISTGGHRVTTLLAKDAVFSAIFDMMIVLLKNKPLILWSQTIGPFKFENEENKKMVQKILANSSRIYIRDESSAEELKQMDISMNNVFDTRESVIGLFDLVDIAIKPSNKPKILGISVYMAQKRNARQREDYETAISQLIDHSVKTGYSVKFFPMEMEGSDLSCINAIIARCHNKEACSLVQGYPDTAQHIKMVSDCRMFVGHKTHSVVFALTIGTPVLAIAYHHKTSDFMNQAGLSDYCVDDKNLSGLNLINIFEKMETHLDEINEKELAFGKKFGTKVKEDFKKLIEDFNHSK